MLKSCFCTGNRNQDALEILPVFATSLHVYRNICIGCWFVWDIFLVDEYEMFRFTRRVTLLTSDMPCRACTWEWLEQGMVHGFVAWSSCLELGRWCSSIVLHWALSLRKGGVGRLGHPHQSCEFTAVQCGTTDTIHPLHTYRLKHTSRFYSDRVDICIQLFSIPCKILLFSCLNQRFLFSSNSLAITVNY